MHPMPALMCPKYHTHFLCSRASRGLLTGGLLPHVVACLLHAGGPGGGGGAEPGHGLPTLFPPTLLVLPAQGEGAGHSRRLLGLADHP